MEDIKKVPEDTKREESEQKDTPKEVQQESAILERSPRDRSARMRESWAASVKYPGEKMKQRIKFDKIFGFCTSKAAPVL